MPSTEEPITSNQSEQTSLLVPTTAYSRKGGLYVRRAYKPKKVWRTCQNPDCGKRFLIYKCWVKRGRGNFCSISCRQEVNIRKYLHPYNDKHKTGGQYWTEERKKAWSEKITGEGNPSWKGGVTYFRKHGNYGPVKYVRCPEEYLGMARKDGYVMEHRLLVAKALGRPLLRTEVVHHADHDNSNNSLDNLVLFASNRDHKLHEAGHPIKPLWQLSQK